MASDELNLLPWREQRDQRLLRHLLVRLVLCILLGTAIWLGSHIWVNDLKQKISINSTALQQVRTQLLQTEQQINQFRAAVQQPQEQHGIDSVQVIELLQQLASLPFQQGELNEIRLSRNQLILTGLSENQNEFNQLHQFLRQQSLFAQIKLAQFKPQAQDILFQFELQLKEPQ